MIKQFEGEIERIGTLTKAGKLPIEQRMIEVERAVSSYLIAHSEHVAGKSGFNPPDSNLLDRMNYWLLYEEYSDRKSYKSRHSEYPILSDTQIARRQSGKHGRGGENIGEARLEGAANYGMDGRNYRVPKRRRRSQYEHDVRDRELYSRNAERKKRYEDFIKPQPVRLYNVANCRLGNELS